MELARDAGPRLISLWPVIALAGVGRPATTGLLRAQAKSERTAQPCHSSTVMSTFDQPIVPTGEQRSLARGPP